MTATLTYVPVPTALSVDALAGALHPSLRERLAAMTASATRMQRALAWWLRAKCIEEVTGLAPGEQCFATAGHGRPVLVGRDDVHVSLAHSASLVACLVSRRGPAGVDTEPLERRPDWTRLDARVFAPAERAWLDELPAVARDAERIRLWTLKEAWAKADGRGVGLGLGGIVCRRAGTGWSVAGPAGMPVVTVGQRDIGARDSLAWALAAAEPVRLRPLDPAAIGFASDVVA